jgi:NADH-quinone oxidoreductase subunit M
MILSTIVFLPLVGALLVLLAGGRGDRPEREGTVRLLALAVSLVAFAATLFLWWRFTRGARFPVRRPGWLPQFILHLGVDGISCCIV